jgi:hypothetical protein
MANRNNNRTIFNNNDSLYDQKFKDRGVTSISQFKSADLKYPTPEQIATLERINHIWKHGDSFEKLAYLYYKDSTFWWVIPFFNQKPTEQHYSIGDNVYIPLPLYAVMNVLGY